MASLADRGGIHSDLGAYLLGALRDDELHRFAAHLASCEECRATSAQLERTAELLARATVPEAPPPELQARTLGAIRAAAANGRGAIPERPSPPRRRLRWPRPALAGGLAVVLAAAVLAGTRLGGAGGPPGTPELEATLASPSGATATATVRESGAGRVIRLRTDALPILPEGDYYELWFVAPGDRRGAPDRISAGTFHPDPDGRIDVRLAAAVDPRKYPSLAVTREPGDGNPAPSRPDVLRSPP